MAATPGESHHRSRQLEPHVERSGSGQGMPHDSVARALSALDARRNQSRGRPAHAALGDLSQPDRVVLSVFGRPGLANSWPAH
jgi:hypothetical protein